MTTISIIIRKNLYQEFGAIFDRSMMRIAIDRSRDEIIIESIISNFDRNIIISGNRRI